MQESKKREPDESPAFERHLATIMMADVVGYSRMMGENEERTVRMLRGHREIFDALLKAHRGRIFNTAGDAILAEFPSAVEAVRCATDIQSALRTRNEHFPEEQRMWFRIGINLGDVITQGSDLLGDGVNVAARIQTVAEPGGVCISGSVYDQIQNKLTLQFKMLGERNFKNIAQPIRTFSITGSENGPILPVNAPLPASSPKNRGPMLPVAVAVVLLLAAGIGGYWLYQAREESRRPGSGQEQTAVIEQRQAEEIRQAVEAAKRQARLEAEAEFAKAALGRAEQEKQRLDQKLRQAEAEKRAIEAQRLVLEAQTLKAAQERAAAAEAKSKEKSETETAGLQSGAIGSDGLYEGELCNQQTAERDRQCWTVLLKVKNGELYAEWMTRAGKPGTAKGTIAADGTVAITLAAWRPDGQGISATLSGKATDKMIKASGKWGGKLPVNGEWKKAD
jgi:class 3 adenylate cyclase